MIEKISVCGGIMTSKALVAFFTKGGATEEYANIITETLTKNGLMVETSNLAQSIPDIEPYDTIIVGTGVRMFRVYGRWKKILKQKTLDRKNLFMFLSSGTAIEDPEKAVEKFLRPIVNKYGLQPRLLISFPGKIPGKWAKMDDQKETVKPELAKSWAQEIAAQIKSK